MRKRSIMQDPKIVRLREKIDKETQRELRLFQRLKRTFNALTKTRQHLAALERTLNKRFKELTAERFGGASAEEQKPSRTPDGPEGNGNG